MDRVVLVTGGTRGIGEAVVSKLLNAGHSVATCARTLPELEGDAKLAEDTGRLLRSACDVTNFDQLAGFVSLTQETFGRIDTAVLNAGVNANRGWSLDDMRRWSDVVNVNLLATAHLAGLLVPIVTKSDAGQLVFVGSVVGERITPASIYSITKAAVAALAESVWRDIREGGDKVTAVCLLEPGWVETGLLSNPRDAALSASKVAEAIMFVVGQPKGVEIRRLAIRPTAQIDY